MEQEFPSNAVWNQRLAQAGLSRSIPHTQTGTDENGQSMEHTLEIQILFHQFYVEYRMDGQVLCSPLLPFWGLSQIEDDEIFLLLHINSSAVALRLSKGCADRLEYRCRAASKRSIKSG